MSARGIRPAPAPSVSPERLNTTLQQSESERAPPSARLWLTPHLRFPPLCSVKEHEWQCSKRGPQESQSQHMAFNVFAIGSVLSLGPRLITVGCRHCDHQKTGSTPDRTCLAHDCCLHTMRCAMPKPMHRGSFKVRKRADVAPTQFTELYTKAGGAQIRKAQPDVPVTRLLVKAETCVDALPKFVIPDAGFASRAYDTA